MWKQLSGRRSIPSGSKKVKIKYKEKKLRSTPGLNFLINAYYYYIKYVRLAFWIPL